MPGLQDRGSPRDFGDDGPLDKFHLGHFRAGLCGKKKFYGAVVLHRRVVLHTIFMISARRRGGVGLSPLDRASAPDTLVDLCTG